MNKNIVISDKAKVSGNNSDVAGIYDILVTAFLAKMDWMLLPSAVGA